MTVGDPGEGFGGRGNWLEHAGDGAGAPRRLGRAAPRGPQPALARPDPPRGSREGHWRRRRRSAQLVSGLGSSRCGTRAVWPEHCDDGHGGHGEGPDATRMVQLRGRSCSFSWGLQGASTLGRSSHAAAGRCQSARRAGRSGIHRDARAKYRPNEGVCLWMKSRRTHIHFGHDEQAPDQPVA